MSKVKVRHIKRQEIFRIAEMGRNFAGLLPHTAEYHYDGVLAMARWLMDTPGKVLFVAVADDKIIGAVAGTVDPMYQYIVKEGDNIRNYMLAQEIFWWVEPEYRRTTDAGIRLLDTFEKWAEQNGADGVTMMNFDHLDKAPVKIYEHRGYKVYENHYLKEL